MGIPSTGRAQSSRLRGLSASMGQLFAIWATDPGEVFLQCNNFRWLLRPTRTVYSFSEAGVRLVLTFFAPAFPDDIDLLSRPVTYLSWDVAVTDGKKHDAAIYLDCDPVLAVDTASQQVVWSRAQVGPLTVMSVGSRDQRVLDRSGDNLRIDWGYFHLGVPDGAQQMTANSADAMSVVCEIREASCK